MTTFEYNPFTSNLDLVGTSSPGTIGPSQGGTGVVNPTAHGVAVAEGAANFNFITLADGQLLIGSTGADPVATTLTAGTNVSITNAAGSITINATGSLPADPLTVPHGGTGLSTITAHSLVVGEGTANMVALGAATNGQLVIGSTGADPVLALPTNGTNISWTGGAGSLTADLSGQVSVPHGGTGLSTLTQNGVLYGNGASNAGVTAAATNGQVIIGATGSAPTFASLAGTQGVTYTTGANSLSIGLTNVPNSALQNSSLSVLAGTGLTGGGSVSLGSSTTLSLTSPVSVANGGTGVANPTVHTIPIAEGSGPFNFVGPLTNGQLLIGNSGNDPSAASITSSDGSITATGGAGTLSLTGTAATTLQRGSVILATNAEAITGTDTAKALTSDDLKAKLGAQTAHGVLVGNGTAGAVTALAVGSTNTVLVGSTGADPAFGQVPNGALANSSVTLSSGTNISVTGGGPLSLGGTATIATVSNPTFSGIVTQSAGQVNAVTLPATNYSVSSSDYFIGVNTAAPRTITLPGSPTTGQKFEIADVIGSAASNNITVAGNGQNINGSATFIINGNYQSITLIATGSIWKTI